MLNLLALWTPKELAHCLALQFFTLAQNTRHGAGLERCDALGLFSGAAKCFD
jgi:hypothetical protein